MENETLKPTLLVEEEPKLTEEQQQMVDAIEAAIKEGKPLPSSLNIYHRPGTEIEAHDGAKYIVAANGSWTKTQKKTRWKDIYKAQKKALQNSKNAPESSSEQPSNAPSIS